MTWFVLSVAPVAAVVTSCPAGSPTALNVLDISDMTQFFKSSSISRLINGESRDLQKLLKDFNGTTTSASNILLR